MDILSDREGILVAADNGLWRFSGDAPPLSVAAPAAVDADNFRALAVTAEGLWLGTNNSGAWLRDDAGWRHYAGGPDAPRSVYRMTVEPSGTLYIATSDNGVFLKRPGHAALEHWGTENGLPSNVVSVVLEDRENNVWVGTDIGGLARLSGMAVINHTERQGLPSACVFGITQGDSPDSLWLGTMRGAVHYQVRPQPQGPRDHPRRRRPGQRMGLEGPAHRRRNTLVHDRHRPAFPHAGGKDHPRPAARSPLPAHGPLRDGHRQPGESMGLRGMERRRAGPARRRRAAGAAGTKPPAANP